MFVLYNPNPKKKMVGDCTVRAICKATGYTWEEVYMSLFVEGMEKYDMPSSNEVWGGYLRKVGWTRTSIRDNCPDCYSVADFAREHPNGTYILALEKHVVCVYNGDWYDTWNCSQEPVHFIWKKEE